MYTTYECVSYHVTNSAATKQDTIFLRGDLNSLTIKLASPDPSDGK